MHGYSVYGLGLRSELPLPELLAASPVEADVIVRVGEVPQGTPPARSGPDESWAERRALANETLCVFSGVGRYLVLEGRHIVVAPEPGVDAAVVRHLLLGPVLAHLLWQRGVFTLHASVVGLHGRHLGFMGVSGEGKSTLAAALEAAGHTLVCDDVAALREREERLVVLPAFPRIRLYPDAVVGLGTNPTDLPLVHPLIDKRSKGARTFASEPVPLDRLYVLTSGDDFAMEPLAAREALMQVLHHTYYAHQYAPLYGFKKHLEEAARVVERIPVLRLVRPKDLARLDELVGFLEARFPR